MNCGNGRREPTGRNGIHNSRNNREEESATGKRHNIISKSIRQSTWDTHKFPQERQLQLPTTTRATDKIGWQGIQKHRRHHSRSLAGIRETVPRGRLPEVDTREYDDGIGIDISNHHLRLYPQEDAAFENGAGPKGILAAACTKRNLVHTEDNKVRFASSIDDKGERR